ncbi:MAG: hypothetical protein HOV78_12375 [Hamadaea sp.]|uniref:Uncharacterized protein n=1 Tax=Glycomyces artemisiae TaxID=1076443 RepID=A0A850CDM2_9ACTN|nr:hypothetical protein [Hamadaea sp.]NUQ90021.1 hypothetical protein [Glycomyces artemisiae]
MNALRPQVVHALFREPRDVEQLLPVRLDGDRPRRLLTSLVPVEVFEHVWLCGPLQLAEEARPAPASLLSVYTSSSSTPMPRRSENGTTMLDGRRGTTAVSREITLLDGAHATRGDLSYGCKCGTCRAVIRARSTCAATTRSNPRRSRPGSS